MFYNSINVNKFFYERCMYLLTFNYNCNIHNNKKPVFIYMKYDRMCTYYVSGSLFGLVNHYIIINK